jgi:hypothetical protein
MPDLERHVVITHAIGPTGALRLALARGSVRIRGIDGDECRVEARYPIPADAAVDANPAGDGVLRVTREDGELQVEVTDALAGGIRSALGWLTGSARRAVHFDVAMPRSALLTLSTVNAAAEISGLTGDQEIRGVSAGVRIRDAAGRLRFSTVSGDLSLAGTVLALDASTTSGALDVDVEQLLELRAHSVSGDVRLVGRLAAGIQHSVESVSGDLRLAMREGVTVTTRGISGAVRAEVPTRQETAPGGGRVVIVGDGTATLSFRTLSGDLRLVAPPAVVEDALARGGDPGSTRDAERAPAVEPAATDAMVIAGAWVSAASTVGADAQPSPGIPAWSSPAPADDAPLAILQALERGEIDVDEAARRLQGGAHV